MMIAFMGDCLLLKISKFEKQKKSNLRMIMRSGLPVSNNEGMNTNEERKKSNARNSENLITDCDL